MKRSRTTIIGIACGLACAACVFAYAQGVRGEADAARAEALARYGGEQLEVCVAKRDIAAGESVDASAVETRLWVPEGLTALSVPAKDVQAVGGAVAAGSRVDVYATGGTSTDVLASGVLVLATSASAQESTTDAKVSWITVAVAPESVQEIVAAAQKTELYFTLPGSEGER